MQQLIEVKNFSMIFSTPGHWTPGQAEFARCLGLGFHENKFYADLFKLNRKSLFQWLNYAYPQIMRTDRWKNFREYMLFPELKARYYDIEQMFKNEEMVKLPYADKLWRHQLESLILLRNRKHNLLALDQGLGKSITSISVSTLINADMTYIITPALPKWNWFYRMVEDWGFNATDFTIFDAQKSFRGVSEQYILINYDIVAKHLKDLQSISKKKKNIHVIFDECQYIKNTGSQRTKAVRKFIESINAKITFLSGTPLKNKVDDLYSYLKLIGHELGRNKEKFINQFTHKNVDGHKQKWRARNTKELNAKLGNFMIRVRKEECSDIPKKSFRKYYYELNDYREQYEEALHMLAKSGKKLGSHIHTVNIVASLAKIKGVISMAEQHIEEDRKIVIFSGYRKPFQLLQEHFQDRAVYINGETPSQQRAEIANRFQNDSGVKCFVGQTEAAGVGIDLYASSDVIFCDLPLTASALAQAMDRVHRIGQTQSVMVNYMIAKETIDEALYELIAKKAEDTNKVIDGGDSEIDYRNAPEEMIRKILGVYKQYKTKTLL